VPPRRMRYSLESRCRIVQLILDGSSPEAAAAASGASRVTGYRLWRRYREGGWAALTDRRPVPRRQPRRLSPAAEAEILAAREYAHAGPVIVAGLLGRPASTAWKVLRPHGRSRLPRPPREPVRRYERERPGELVHVDIKRLGGFWTIGKAILADGLNRSPAPAGSTSTSPSMITRGSPTRSCAAARAPPTALPSCRRRSRSTASTESRSSAS
jgi:transposase-like protein